MLNDLYTFLHQYKDVFALLSTFVLFLYIADDVRKSHRLRKGTDIIVHPQLTLFTEDGDKIHVLSINEEQGRYVLYHSRTNGLQLATHREFLKLKSGRTQNERS